MSWKWEELTSPEFGRAVEEVKGVCVLPLGVLERHGDHLPVGTDLLFVRKVAEMAAEKEPAIIFPEYYFGQIQEAKHYPGCIAIGMDLQFLLLETMFEEIARNGLQKILLLNGHGGNESMLAALALRMLEKPRSYTLYIARLGDYLTKPLETPEWKAMMQTEFDHHGGEMETSAFLTIRPDLVRMDRISAPGLPQQRLAHLPSVLTPIWWYADFPYHYAGDAAPATREKGEFLLEQFSTHVANIIRAVKEDIAVAELEKEFHTKTQH